MISLYKYKNENYICGKCRWSGAGEQAETAKHPVYYDNPYFDFQLLCPQCGDLLDTVTNSLSSPDQLPEIDSEHIVISLREEGYGEGETYYANSTIVLYWGEQELWRRPGGFEYYTDYISMGEILKIKYGERLVDFEAEYTANLGGDYGRAFDIVREFRESLRGSRFA